MIEEKSKVPNRYELIDKDGVPCMVFDTAQEAAAFAQQAWPDQEQDEGRTGRGWDIRNINHREENPRSPHQTLIGSL